MPHRLKKKYKELIKNNNLLSAAIADELLVKNTAIPVAVYRNSISMISLPVLDIIKAHAKDVDDVHDLIEKVSTDTAIAVAAN